MAKIPDSDFEGLEEGDFSAMSQRFEPLRKELHEYLEETKFGYFIRHPFCNSPIYDLDRCAVIHHTIDERTAEADACFERQDWEGYLNCIEICIQPKWLAKDASLFPDDRFWGLVREVYQSQKLTHQYRDIFAALFGSNRPFREMLMAPEEQELLARLPEQVTVYRGFWDEEDFEDGNAWTLDRRAAVWYANLMWNEHQGDPVIVRGVVDRKDILALWDGDTVIVPRRTVRPVKFRRARSKKARAPWNEFVHPPFDIETFLAGR